MKSAAASQADWAKKYGSADPLIQIVDELDIPISILRAVFLALGNPETEDIGYKEECLRLIDYAAHQLVRAQRIADAAVHEIRRGA
jgi:hypothetical protein